MDEFSEKKLITKLIKTKKNLKNEKLEIIYTQNSHIL